MLNRVIANLVGVPSAERHAGNIPLWIAFGEMGVQSFLGDLITLTEEDIMSLQVRPTRTVPPPPPIPIMCKCKTVIVIPTYQHYARLKGASIDMRLFPVELFYHFCISIYGHDEKVIPWQVELPSQVNSNSSFLKSTKPNLKEYKVLQDDKSWLPFRESTETMVMHCSKVTSVSLYKRVIKPVQFWHMN